MSSPIDDWTDGAGLSSLRMPAITKPLPNTVVRELPIRHTPAGQDLVPPQALCNECGIDVVAFEKQRMRNESNAAPSYVWWLAADKEPIVWSQVGMHCGKCRPKLALRRRCLSGDGPVEWFSGKVAFAQYLRLCQGYPFTPEALRKLQDILLALQDLPTYVRMIDGVYY